MTFDEAIRKIMPDVERGYNDPLIIYRDKSNEWHCETTTNQHGETFAWVEEAREQDPLAVEFAGKDFSKGSFPYVYDAVLCKRLRMEYTHIRESGIDTDNLKAHLNFFEDNAGEFSEETTEYLTTLDRPLSTLAEMSDYNMTTANEGCTYNEGLTDDAIKRIEDEAYIRFHGIDDDRAPKKSYIDGYEEKHNIRIAGQNVVFAENPQKDERYLVCNIFSDNSLGFVYGLWLCAFGTRHCRQILRLHRRQPCQRKS